MKVVGNSGLFPTFLFVVLLFPESRAGVLPLEFLDPAGFHHHRTPFPGVEGVAGRTYGHLDLLDSGTGLKGIAASAGHTTFLVFRVYVFFHWIRQLLGACEYSQCVNVSHTKRRDKTFPPA